MRFLCFRNGSLISGRVNCRIYGEELITSQIQGGRNIYIFDWLVGLPKERVLKKANSAEIVFEKQDFDGFLRKLKEYPIIEYLGKVIEHSWGQRVLRYYDYGHIIEVGEDMKMVIVLCNF